MGRKGGQATAAKYGSAHMSAIGQAGFLALARRLGYMGGSHKGAVLHLQAIGRLKQPAPTSAEALRALHRKLGLDD
jgi:hypothetical protein